MHTDCLLSEAPGKPQSSLVPLKTIGGRGSFLFMALLGLSCCAGFSPAVASGDYPLVAAHKA